MTQPTALVEIKHVYESDEETPHLKRKKVEVNKESITNFAQYERTKKFKKEMRSHYENLNAVLRVLITSNVFLDLKPECLMDRTYLQKNRPTTDKNRSSWDNAIRALDKLRVCEQCYELDNFMDKFLA